MRNKPLVIAVTGGMGCGQTTVCNFLQQMGVRVINADLEAKREIENNEEIKKQLRQEFGSRAFYRNGRLNRKYLAQVVFSDATKTETLNRIVHPQMVTRVIEQIERARESRKYKIIAVDAALIYEINLENMFDAVVVVTARMKQRIERLQARDNMSEKEIIDRINRQIPIEDKKKWADFVVNNYGDLEALQQNTRKLYQQLLNLWKTRQGVSTSRRPRKRPLARKTNS